MSPSSEGRQAVGRFGDSLAHFEALVVSTHQAGPASNPAYRICHQKYPHIFLRPADDPAWNRAWSPAYPQGHQRHLRSFLWQAPWNRAPIPAYPQVHRQCLQRPRSRLESNFVPSASAELSTIPLGHPTTTIFKPLAEHPPARRQSHCRRPRSLHRLSTRLSQRQSTQPISPTGPSSIPSETPSTSSAPSDQPSGD